MKEFKFVRGVYTNKQLFDGDTIDESLFILDANCTEVRLDAIDNESTQTQLVAASEANRDCKLYTITPAQITMKGDLTQSTNGNFYKFTPDVKEICVSNTAEKIPDSVKAKAKTLLSSLRDNCEKVLSKEDIGIGEGSRPDSVGVTFGYGSKNFTKSMKFKVKGTVTKRSFIDLNGKAENNDIVYTLKDNIYKLCTNLTGSFFLNGKKQIEAENNVYKIPKKTTTLSRDKLDEGYDFCVEEAEVADTYQLPSGYCLKNKDMTFTHGDIPIEIYKTDDTNTKVCKFSMDTTGMFLFQTDLDNMYIVDDIDNTITQLTNDIHNRYREQNLQVYTIEDDIREYTVIEDSICKDDTSAVNTRYIKVTDTDYNAEVNDNVQMLDKYIISPKHGQNYFIEINSNVKVTASEV
ncbi:MAG: hypothetical protein II304_02455 [Bacteroidales bacterium]|nr:hypothetical protein [Bacteroidales bacterium]